RTLATTTAIQYFGNSSDYFSDARTPEIAEIDYSKMPSTILQAKQALALAKYAGAQRDAAEELREAETLMQSADTAWKAGRAEEDVDITARKAISAAVKAETTAAVRKEAREQRNARSRQDADLREQEEKFQDSQNQIAELKAELARETRNRELAERDAINFANQVKELREQINQLQTEAQNAKVKLANIEGQTQAMQEQREREQKTARLQANVPILMESLKRFGAVSQTERGIVLTLPENYWVGTRVSDFAPNGETNLGSLSEVLANSTDYKVVIESHTDNKVTPEELQTLTQERAKAIADKIMLLGVTADHIEAKGYGAALPVAPNTTNANRAKNRRVQIILLPLI
ncbi:MAG: OmpA family protein, partial [Acidobacteria bacterium]|nr:OmpA family protein [Acidobacteriota bacterium]